MTRRLVLSYLSIAVFVLLILEIPLGVNFARTEQERLSTAVERDAAVIGSRVEDLLQEGSGGQIDPNLGEYLAESGGRVLITDANGITVYDSDHPNRDRRDYSTRPEVAQALRGQRAVGTRHSDTLHMDLLYVAVPVASGGNVFGMVRITYPMTRLDARIQHNWLLLGAIAAIVLIATGLVGWAVARWVTRPTRLLDRAVADFADGDLDVRAPEDDGPPELRDLSHRFNEMAARLSELISAQQAFVADASHQLRTPLTAVRLELENLELAADGELRDGLQRASDEVRRLGRLVEGLLVLARADASRPEPSRVDAAAVVRDRQAIWSSLAEEADVSLDVQAPSHALVTSVADSLEQILDNLIANALEVSPAGATVTLRVAGGHDTIEVHVADEGPGMTEEERAHAFDRFWRAASARPGEGSGLGLPIARGLARAGGGDLHLDEADGGGLDAVVVLRRWSAGHAGRGGARHGATATRSD